MSDPTAESDPRFEPASERGCKKQIRSHESKADFLPIGILKSEKTNRRLETKLQKERFECQTMILKSNKKNQLLHTINLFVNLSLI